MANTSNLIKFYKQASAPDAYIGAIWFNTTNRTIQVYTGQEWEVYTGLVDATYTNSTLTITKAVGNPISLDFSNVAKATDLSDAVGRIAALEAWEATAKGEISTLQSEMDAVEKKASDNAAAIAVLNGDDTKAGSVAKAVKDAVDAEAALAREAENVNKNAISDLQTTVDEHATAIADLEANLEAAIGAGGNVATQIDTAVKALDSEVEGNGNYVSVKVVQVDGKINSVTVTDDFSDITTAISDEATRATQAETALQNAIDIEKERIDVLVDKDDAKSVRSIASEEVAKIVANANESYDTLKEIADWIAAHPTDASEYNSRISANETAIAKLNGESEGSVKKAAADAQAAAEATAKNYADAAQAAGETAATQALESAKAYADEKVSDLAVGAVAQNTTDIIALRNDLTTASTWVTFN